MSTYLKPNTTELAPKSPNWLDRHGDYLFGYAKLRLRDDAAAEKALLETLLVALQSGERYANQTEERKWLAGILKVNIIEHCRKTCRTRDFLSPQTEPCRQHDPFQGPDEWLGHWKPELAPRNWELDAAATLERGDFWQTLSRSLAHLPEKTAMAFTLREIDGLSSDEVCDVLNLSPRDLSAILHCARLELRSLMEAEIFGGKRTNPGQVKAKAHQKSDVAQKDPPPKRTLKLAALVKPRNWFRVQPA